MWNMCNISQRPPAFMENVYYYDHRIGHPYIHGHHYWSMPPVEFHWRPIDYSVMEMETPQSIVMPSTPYRSLHGPPWYPSQQLCQQNGIQVNGTVNLNYPTIWIPNTPLFIENERATECTEKIIHKETNHEPKTKLTVLTKNTLNIVQGSNINKENSKYGFSKPSSDINDAMSVKMPDKIQCCELNKFKTCESTDKHRIDIKNKEQCTNVVEETLEKGQPSLNRTIFRNKQSVKIEKRQIIKSNKVKVKNDITVKLKLNTPKTYKTECKNRLATKSKHRCKNVQEENLNEEEDYKNRTHVARNKKSEKIEKQQRETTNKAEMSSDTPKTIEKEDSTGQNVSEETITPDESKRDIQRIETIAVESSSSELDSSLRKKRKTIFIESDDKDEDSPASRYDISSPAKRAHESSLYMTPESTPTSHSTPDTSERPRFKRSLMEQYSVSSPNQSWRSSVYSTPDTSPSEFGSSRKRLKTRWSASWREDSSYSNKSFTSDISQSDEFQPELIGYQLVGDSQFCRFGQQLLGLQRIPMPNSPGRIGICVSGQTITDLHRRVKDKTFPIAEKIILMIGTNDFLRNVDVTTMCRELSSLINTLQETVAEIVLLTLPPIPKLEMKLHRQHFMAIDQYNNYIRSLEDGDKLRIADVSPLYSTAPPYQKCRMNLFELFFNGPQRRQDLIHLNRNGLEVIRQYSLLLLRRKVSPGLLVLQEEQLDQELDKEVRDYAVRIGINPDTENHLLKIALDGLMSPLPNDWKPYLDERIDRIYYFNTKTNKTQWNHPLDEHFEKIVKRKRQEESISAGDDDSKTSLKEDLKSFEEASDMISSRVSAESHKSRLSSAYNLNKPQAVKDLPPDGRKVLNPIGLPPRPPAKRRTHSTSPKRVGQTPERGSLSLRLSPTPSPTRIDIDSIGIPLGLPSPEQKSDRQPTNRTPAIKLTGGGSAFLKSKQKQSPSPTEEPKPQSEDRSFEIVREADCLDSPDEDLVMFSKDGSERRLRHSASLGESGFDKLTKSAKFTSLHDSLLSLKQEMETHKKSVSPNTSAPNTLRGILRDKPSPTTKLWDMDPKLLSNDEKEQLRYQELKEERKQNVRFADIDEKAINFEFSKSDSGDESNTNDSTNDLDEVILEHVYSDDDMEKERNHNKIKSDLDGFTNIESPVIKTDDSLFKRKESNKNILSRISELNADVERKDTPDILTIKSGMNDNNNKDESDNWLTDTQNTNQNELRIQKLTQEAFDNSKLMLDSENNSIDKHLTEVGFAKSLNIKGGGKFKKDNKTISPIIHKITSMLDKELYSELSKTDEEIGFSQKKDLDLSKIGEEFNDKSNEPQAFHKSKLMPFGKMQEVFINIRESLATSTDHSDLSEDDGGLERMAEVQSALEQNEEDLRRLKRQSLKDQFEENIKGIQKEFQRQESLEKQRFYEEVQQSVARYKEEIETEKTERESKLRAECNEFLKELEKVLSNDKELKTKKLKEEHEAFMKEQENKIKENRQKFEEESKLTLENSSLQLEKILASMKHKEEEEITKFKAESAKRIDEINHKIEQEQADQEQKHKQELAIVEADYERILLEKQAELEKLQEEKFTEVTAAKLQQEEAIAHIKEQHRLNILQLQDQFQQEEDALRRKHAERVEAVNAQLKASEREDLTQLNREFEKVRCEKRLLEDKYKSLKEKYVRLKNEVRLSMERKRQAKLNRQLQQQQRDPASTTEDTTERSTDHGKPPIARRKLTTALSSDDQSVENPVGTPKTIKRRPKPPASGTITVESSNSIPPARPKNVWNPSPQRRREGASSAEDNHTSVSEEIQMEQDDFGNGKWTQSALTPLDNLRKQLEKLDDLEEKFPTSVHTDTYLRYPFSGPGASGELEFYRHRLHLERESVRRAKQALSEQRLNIEARQVQLRQKQHTETLHQLHQEERELTDMEVSLHRTRALLGEKIIRLRYLEQSIERATLLPSHHSQTNTDTNTDSSGFSGSDIEASNNHCVGGRTDMMWNENVLLSLENINSEIREIWTILAKQQVQGLGPAPVLNYESRGIGQGGLEERQASDIMERTRRLKEWLVRSQDTAPSRMIAPVTL